MRASRLLAPQMFALGLFVATPVLARTWNVLENGSGNAPTVQAGIDSSAAGDTVLVYPGTYHEAINFQGKVIVVRSLSGPEATTLDATGLSRRVVTFESGESRSAVIRGFTITHGNGGVLVVDSQPSVIDNVITANDNTQNGGGIWCGAGTFFPWYPLIEANTITNNQAGSLAGGVGTQQRMVLELVNNYIANNDAMSGDGGGIYYRSFDNGAVIRGNTVINNRAGDHGGGIYVALVGSPPPALQVEISWNLVAYNVAHGSAITGVSGGGIHLIETNAWVHHNTIVGNEGGGTANTLGGGIGIERIGTPLIEKNIIAYSTQGGGINCVGGATPTIQNNLAWQNAGGDGVGDCATWWQTNGNIVADPAFCDTLSGDFHLHQDSPAITHVAGPLGVYPIPGCGPVPVRHTTWGILKSKYRTDQ